MKKGITVVLFAVLLNLLASSFALTEEKKDERLKVSLMSFLIPGLGQYYIGSQKYAKLFIAIEFAIWGDYYYNYSMMHASRKDYIAQSVIHSGVNPAKYGGAFMNAVGSYDNTFEYNQNQLQYYVDPVFYGGDRSWAWDSESSRYRYKNLREKELNYENNTKFCVAGIIANHFISALHASKNYKIDNKKISFFTVNSLNDGLIATYTRSF